MDRSPFLNTPSHGVTYCLATVGDGDQVLVMIEPGPAVGAAGVVHPLAAVDVVGVHGSIDGALNGFLTQSHHRAILKCEYLFHLVCGGGGDCVGDHGLGVNCCKHSTDPAVATAEPLRESELRSLAGSRPYDATVGSVGADDVRHVVSVSSGVTTSNRNSRSANARTIMALHHGLNVRIDTASDPYAGTVGKV